jgi:hypothetical protein
LIVSETYTLPAPSTATPSGEPNPVATSLLAQPPLPSGVYLRIARLFVSATYTLPAASIATLPG